MDLGSGKGRVVLLAATRNFARLTGVEFAEELHESAVPVFRAMEDSTGRRVASVLGDAGSFEFQSILWWSISTIRFKSRLWSV